MKTLLPFFLLFFCLIPLKNHAQNDDIITDSIYSQTLQEQRQYWVKFPSTYKPESKEKYPVVYLLDGYSLKRSLITVYENYWGHYMPHMILVGISNQTNRTRDLTISKVTSRRGASMNMETGGAENFTKFIENELIPHIDKTLPTTTYRTLIGHSYAGLFTVNMLVNHSHLFHNYIAIDPSLEWDNQKLLKEAKQKLSSLDLSSKSLYVSLAAEQLHIMNENITPENVAEDTSEFTLFARTIIEFCKLAETTQNGLNFSWKVYPDDLHGTVPLPTIRDGLLFAFNWYQFLYPQKYNNPETSISEIKKMLEQQAAIYKTQFGYDVPPMVEELFTGYGYMNMQMGSPEKAEMFFKMATKYYPDSANAFDSLAEFYESRKNYNKALEHITKAFQISKSKFHKERLEAIKAKLN